MPNPNCSVPGCEKSARSGSAKWCKMHYHRWYRHGSPDKTAWATDVTASAGRRYKVVCIPGHPLAGVGNKVYEHRAVLYAVIGPGPHTCHWCCCTIDWLPKTDSNHIQPDHLNGIGDDNRPENLVASCRWCNVTRGMQARADALRDAGWWSQHDTIANLANQQRAPRVA